MIGLSKHAKEVLTLLSNGGITHSEAMQSIEKYDRIMLRWQAIILTVIVAATFLLFSYLVSPPSSFKSGSECVLAKIKPGMTEFAARTIEVACMDKYGDF